MTVIKILAVIIFAISCVTIYHNTNSFEPKMRIAYIAIGMIVMYIITSIICAIDTSGINVESTEALDETVKVIKWIFTPINAMIALAPLGNTFGKLKDEELDKEKAGKRLIIMLIALIIICVFETNYISNFINGVLG